MFCLLFSMALGFVQPFISQRIIDDGLVGQNLRTLAVLCAVSLVLYSINSILEIIKEKHRLFIYNAVHYKLEKEAFMHLLKIKMDFYNDKNVSNIHQTIKQDVAAISSVVRDETFQILTAFLSAIGGGVALFCIEWRLGVAIVLFMPINALATWLMSRKNYTITNDYITKTTKYNEWFGETVNGVRDIRLFGIQRRKKKELTAKQEDLKDINTRQGMTYVKNEQLQLVLLQAMSMAIYMLAGILMYKSNISIGKIVAFQTYALLLSTPITMGLGLLFEASSIFPSIKRHFEFMQYDEETQGEKKCQGNGDIVFDNVAFTYNENKSLLTDISFRIEKGSKVAILGRNGVGKTTVLNLILRILSPVSGSITLSGEDISNYDIASYRELFGVVSQNIFLFNTSIRNNICLYREVSEERLEEVLRLVNLTELVAERGLDYKVGENGCMLSGGQKQKIAIARALIHERPIIVFDEATSNLDKETVGILTDLFDSELRDNTVICVTHTDGISDIFGNKICL